MILRLLRYIGNSQHQISYESTLLDTNVSITDSKETVRATLESQMREVESQQRPISLEKEIEGERRNELICFST